MNIKPISSTPVAEISINNTKNTAQPVNTTNSVNQDAASVQFSTKATDPAKLEKLKAQVQSGTYSPNMNDVAKAIARDLL
jgi:anti-sigma28 factor (negative regulator of flagellin synthesis)